MLVPADNLRTIKNFADLVRYLEDELDWPLQEYGFDELTFEYSPAELGLRDEDAAKIKAIHQLRPMAHGQPFGIFFVEFERKRMPVVVLRRILSHLVIHKRASANRANAAAWNLDDLLFISAFGDEASGQREIAFAHFWADPESPGDLPVLKVLGWDDSDTVLHLADADQTLRKHLVWPQDTSDVRAWRSQWSAAFTLRHREVIETARDLVEELARLATAIRRRMNAILASESEQGPIRRLHADFRKTLIHDLSEDDFADVVAQTISYGLLAARFSRPMGISVHDLPRMVPPTNPFLRELLEMFLEATGHTRTLNFDELGIQDVVEVLNRAQADAVKADFGNRTRSEDPVVHFYEHFLKAYDARRKVQRGVFYTPQPVVSYIVRSVHELLQTEFGIEDGLASPITWGELAARHKELVIPDGVSPNAPFVVVLDPATGTGTFLVEVIEVIFRTLQAKWARQGLSASQQAAAWNVYVPEHLFPRLFGYELMMAPYAIAHMKLGLKLSEINTRLGQPDYQFKFAGRAHIYLTNALEPAQDFQDQFAFVAPALAHEAQAVSAIKRGQRFTVVIGNPPYSNFGQLNRIPFILDLLNDYKRGLGERKINLDDDFIKFVRFSQYLLDSTGTGILAMITNNAFVDGITHRQMRRSLMQSFTTIFVMDLHGSSKKKEQGPEGLKEENVFDIQQGVSISIFSRQPYRSSHTKLQHADLWGPRAEKYNTLAQSSTGTTQWTTLTPEKDDFFFTPKQSARTDEYQEYLSLGFLVRESISGVQTKKDGLFTGYTITEVGMRMRAFLDPIKGLRDPMLQALLVSADDWIIAKAQGIRFDEAAIKPMMFAPFDWRYVYYDPKLLGRARYKVMRHILRRNQGMVFMRQSANQGEYDHVFAVTTLVTDRVFYSANGAPFLFPLYIYADDDTRSDDLFGQSHGHRIPNFTAEFIECARKRLSLGFISDGSGDFKSSFGPEDIFHYIYAVFHSPTYRTRYAAFLKIDFPRVPLTGSLDLFRGLAALGGELVALHLMESPALAQHITTWAGPATPEVEKVSYADGAVWINKAQTAGFRGVPEAVWSFHIGGYQVCDKWLKDRKGRTLSAEDIEHYQRVVVALSETIRVMGEIDAAIDAHGGWPIQ